MAVRHMGLRTGLGLLLCLSLAACNGDSTSADTAQPGGRDEPPPAASGPRSTASGPDIAGIQLGMTMAEAEAKLKEYDPNIRLQTSSRVFTYYALGARYKTEPQPVAIIGQSNVDGARVQIEVGFTYPPNPPRVVSISRNHSQTSAPPSEETYVASLIEKYGKPARDYVGEIGSTPRRFLEWSIGGGSTPCLAEGGRAYAGDPVTEQLVRNGQRVANPTLADVEDCASVFRYMLTGDPVTAALGFIADVATAARAELETQAWIEQLIAEKSQAGSDKPKL